MTKSIDSDLTDQIVRNEYACHLIERERKATADQILKHDQVWVAHKETSVYLGWRLWREVRSLGRVLRAELLWF